MSTNESLLFLVLPIGKVVIHQLHDSRAVLVLLHANVVQEARSLVESLLAGFYRLLGVIEYLIVQHAQVQRCSQPNHACLGNALLVRQLKRLVIAGLRTGLHLLHSEHRTRGTCLTWEFRTGSDSSPPLSSEAAHDFPDGLCESIACYRWFG